MGVKATEEEGEGFVLFVHAEVVEVEIFTGDVIRFTLRPGDFGLVFLATGCGGGIHRCRRPGESMEGM